MGPLTIKVPALVLAMMLAMPGAAGAEVSGPVRGDAPPDRSASASDVQGAPIMVAEQTPVVLGVVPVAESVVPPDTVAADPVRNRAVEEIIVTAQKREENILDVPLSIQAFSGDAMDARGIDDTIQLGQVIPSLQFTGVGGFTLLSLRGIGTDNFVPSADPSVATYIDGIYIPAGQGATTSLGSVRRVEVLKGPQGTLFGRNATGGAINVITEDPGDDLQISASAEVGNFMRRSVNASISGPLSDWLSIGLSGMTLDQDNYYSNPYDKTQDTRQDVARLKIAVHPVESLSLNLTGIYSDQAGSVTTIGKNTRPSLLGTALTIQPQKDNYSGENDFNAVANARQEMLYGSLTWSLSRFDLKLLGSDIYVVTDPSTLDFDGSTLPIAAFDAERLYSKLKTAELQVLSNTDSWFADRLEWVAGLYYLQGEAGGDPVNLRAAPGGVQTAADLVGIELPEGLLDLIDRLPVDDTPVSADGVKLSFTGILETESYSAFAQSTYSFTDWLDLTLGGRYQREKRFITKATTGAALPGSDAVVTIFDFALPPSATAKTFSPKAVLSVRPRERMLVYLSYAVGYKSGTFNNVNIYQPPNYIVPEKVTSYELGAKLGLLDGALQLNGAVFHNDIKDLQSGFVSLLSGGAVQFLTVPAARTRGAEIDGTWLPMPNLNPGLLLTGNAAYIDATYTDFPSCPGFATTTGIYSDNLNCTGNRIVRSPRFSGGIGLVQAIEIRAGSLELAVDQYYNGGFYYDSYNTVEEDPFSIINARISYLHDRSKIRVTLFGKNVLDERYHVQQLGTDFGLVSTLAAPREYGIRLGWDF